MSGLSSVVLIAHIFIAVALIGVVLLQRSEGGALGIGGGAGAFMSARGAGNALTRATMILAAMFFASSLVLTVLSRHHTNELKFETQPAGKVHAPQPMVPGAPGPLTPATPSGSAAPPTGAPALPGGPTASAPQGPVSTVPMTAPATKPPGPASAPPKP
jgi:preprotein translocase subunit SecG